MAKCNLLKPIETGKDGFYTFAQWADDLTLQNALGDAYRIVPSRFACFDIDWTDTLLSTFQNKFEHTCAALKYFFDTDTNTTKKWTPSDCSRVFWQSLVNGNVVSQSDIDTKMVYVGECDVLGTTYVDGNHYSELYCMIPNNAKKMTDWDITTFSGTSQSYTIEGATYPFRWASETYPEGGFPTSEDFTHVTWPGTPKIPTILKPEDTQTQYSSITSLDALHEMYMNNLRNSRQSLNRDDSATEFEFNTIVIFYDIVAKDTNNDYIYLYTAVPMGVYVNRGEKIKKYVTNADIYGQGTSYGLRVTTKFSAESLIYDSDGNPTGDISPVVSIETNYPEMAALMDRFTTAADAMQDLQAVQNEFNTNITNHMSNFKDKSTNIPYIRNVGNSPHWFVNGKDTGVEVYPSFDNDLLHTIYNNIINTVDQHIGETLNSVIQNIQNVQIHGHIRYIDSNKYKGNTIITEIPNIEDFQDLSGNVMNNMFDGCTSLTKIPTLEIRNTTSMISTFKNCESLTHLDLRDSSSVIDFNGAFEGCENLKYLHIDAASATSFENTFKGCGELQHLYIDNLGAADISSIALDLTDTKVDEQSLMYIMDRMPYKTYSATEDNFNSNENLDAHYELEVTFKVKSIMNTQHLRDKAYECQMNKSIKIKIDAQ